MPVYAEPPGFERENPLDVFEQMMQLRRWPYTREDSGTLVTIADGGNDPDYEITCGWNADSEILEVNASFPLPVSGREGEVARLIALISPDLKLGHFERRPEDKLVVFRANMPLTGGASLSDAQCELLFAHAIGVCQQYYPAFNLVVWAGKSANEAARLVSFETEGEA